MKVFVVEYPIDNLFERMNCKVFTSLDLVIKFSKEVAKTFNKQLKIEYEDYSDTPLYSEDGIYGSITALYDDYVWYICYIYCVDIDDMTFQIMD